MVQMASVLSLSLTYLQHLFTPPHPPDGPEHAQPSRLGVLSSPRNELLHPSIHGTTALLPPAGLSSERANPGSSGDEHAQVLSHHVPRHATRNIQDEPNMGKQLCSVHVLGPS